MAISLSARKEIEDLFGKMPVRSTVFYIIRSCRVEEGK